MVKVRKMKTPKILLLIIVFGLILCLLMIFGAQASRAQPPFPRQNKPMFRMEGQEACWKSSDLSITEAQMKALETLQNAYTAEAMPLWRELMLLKLELRHLIRDPDVQPKIVLDRQKKISELWARLDNLWVSYMIKARSIFTKEQLERLPRDCSMGLELGSGMETGSGRGLRRRFGQ
jgi:hypothetical protein